MLGIVVVELCLAHDLKGMQHNRMSELEQQKAMRPPPTVRRIAVHNYGGLRYAAQ